MKRTAYFVSNQFEFNSLQSAVDNSIKKRDEFLKSNAENIAKIESEVLSTSLGINGHHVFAIIAVTYYPKEQ